MYPTILIFGRTVGLYSCCAVVGLLISCTVICIFGKKHGILIDDIILMTVYAAIGLLLGGHFLYGLLSVRTWFREILMIARQPLRKTLIALANGFGGSVFYGGLFGAEIAVICFTKKYTYNQKNLMRDLFAIGVPLFHCFGRIGCFLGGCCYGIESRFGVIVKRNPFVPELCGVRRFPVALAESFANLLLFLILMILFFRKGSDGKMFWRYGMGYSVIRFTTEFLRGDVIRGLWMGLSTSQWISIVFEIISVIMYFYKVKKSPDLR